MDYKTIKFERKGHIGVLTLNRPERLNAITWEMVGELHHFFRSLCDDLSLRVVIIRGEGRAFSAGTDVHLMTAGAPPESELGDIQYTYHKNQQLLAGVALRMRQAPQPLIAAVRGPAAGGGFAIALACDVRIAGQSARFNAAFIRMGLSACDVGLSYFLPKVIGLSRAAEYMYTGRFIDAATAERFGLVSRVVPDEEVETAAFELAEEMLQNSPMSLRMTKEVLNMNIDAPSLESAIHLENRTQSLCVFTKDAIEGPQAFLEKRPAQYQDR